MQPVAQQVIAFFLVTLLGVLLGAVFDLYVTLRYIWRPRQLGTILGDAVFWIFITGICFFFLLLFNWGEVRLYVFLALGLGLLGHIKLVSKGFRKLLLKCYNLFLQARAFLINIFRGPLRIIYRIICLPFKLSSFFLLVFFQGLKGIRRVLLEVAKHLSVMVKKKKEPPSEKFPK